MKFPKTIRFKLTAWYSSLLILLCLFFIIIVNILLTQFIVKDIPEEDLRIPRMWEEKIRRLPNQDGDEIVSKLVEEKRQFLEDQRRADLRQVRVLSFFTFIPLVLLSGVSGYYIAGYMLDPLKKLNNQIKKIDVNNLRSKIENGDVSDEIGELIGHFNEMIARLHFSFDMQKQFVENAAHELKTPLSIIRTNLESALLDRSSSVIKVKKSIETSINSTDFMNKLIEDLLLLSLLDNQVKKEMTNLNKIVSDSIDQISVMAKKQDIVIESWVSKEMKNVELNLNKVLFQRAIMNILENAIKHSERGKKVSIIIEKHKGKHQIKIKDDGVGIAEEEMDKIFERFYRVDKSRSRKTGGFGLGLAIAKKIIEAHNGLIKVNSIVGVGSEFIIQFDSDSE